MPKSVLVVEDEGGVRRALSRLLADWGFRTIEAANGREAIQRLAEETPSAIVIDLLMPIMSGAELLKALRRNAFYRRIPTVVMTGAAPSEGVSAAEALGVPVVFKPNIEKIPEILRGLMADTTPPPATVDVPTAAARAEVSGPIGAMSVSGDAEPR
jgi:CheY-like chemotaxis protein